MRLFILRGLYNQGCYIGMSWSFIALKILLEVVLFLIWLEFLEKFHKYVLNMGVCATFIGMKFVDLKLFSKLPFGCIVEKLKM